MRAPPALQRASLLAALAFASPHAAAATCTWTGASSANNLWSQPLNWLCGSAPGVPADGDTLAFPEIAARKTNVNDIAGLDAASIELTGANYDIGGLGISLATGIFANVAGSGPVVVDPVLRLDLAVTGPGPFNCVGVRGFEVAGDVTLGTVGFTVDGTCGVTISGAVGGAAPITKTGTGTLTLSGSNTYTGATTIQQGTLNAASPSALGAESAPTTVGGSGTIALSNTGSIGEPLVMGANLSTGAIAMRNLAGNNTWKGPIALAGTASIETLPPFALELSGGVEGAADGGIVKTGTGTLVLSSSNTYGGDTYVGQGVLRSQDGGALGPGGETRVDAGAVLELVGVSVAGESLSLSGTGISGTGALRSVGGNNTWGGPIVLVQDTTIGVVADSLTLGGSTSGSSGLTKVGTGTLTLAASNTYLGQTTVNEGVLRLAANGAAGASGGGTVVNVGGALELTNGITLDEGLVLHGTGALRNVANNNTWSGPITLDANPAIDVASGTLTLGGAVGGASGVTKVGTGTLVLSASNTYTGTTTVNEGTLRLLSGGALADAGGGTAVGNGATLQLQGSLTIASEPLTLSGTGALQNLSGDNTWGGPITLQPGPIGVAVDAGSLTISGVVGGGTGLTKAGPGTLVLSNANTYTGTTTVNAGTLSVGGSTGAVAIAGTGRLSGSGAVGAITLGGTGSVAPVGTLDAASLAWDGTASLELQLGPTGAPVDRLVLSGALAKGSGTSFLVRFGDAATGSPEAGLAYVIATYASTTFTPADLRHTYNGNPGMSSMPGAFFVEPTQMEFEALAVALFLDGFE